MDEVPADEIEDAEAGPPAEHAHDGVTAQDGTLAAHLAAAHGLEVPPGVSPTTAEGLHDRLHATAKAADD